MSFVWNSPHTRRQRQVLPTWYILMKKNGKYARRDDGCLPVLLQEGEVVAALLYLFLFSLQEHAKLFWLIVMSARISHVSLIAGCTIVLTQGLNTRSGK